MTCRCGSDWTTRTALADVQQMVARALISAEELTYATTAASGNSAILA